MASKKTLDLKGVGSPLDLLKCKTRLKALDKGDLLDVFLSDEQAAQDLMLIIGRSGDKVVYQANTDNGICLRIKKGPRPYDTLNKQTGSSEDNP